MLHGLGEHEFRLLVQHRAERAQSDQRARDERQPSAATRKHLRSGLRKALEPRVFCDHRPGAVLEHVQAADTRHAHDAVEIRRFADHVELWIAELGLTDTPRAAAASRLAGRVQRHQLLQFVLTPAERPRWSAEGDDVAHVHFWSSNSKRWSSGS